MTLKKVLAVTAATLMAAATMVAPQPALAGAYGYGWVTNNNRIEICRQNGNDCAVFVGRDDIQCFDDDLFFIEAVRFVRRHRDDNFYYTSYPCRGSVVQLCLSRYSDEDEVCVAARWWDS